MLHTTLALARRVERCEIDFCAAGARAGQPGGADVLDIGGGRALCGAPGSPTNKVLGLGLGVDVTDQDLDELEDFYDERGVSGQIELCPLASPGLAARLNQRGYLLQGFENELGCELGSDMLPEPGTCRIVATDAATEDLWLSVVSRAFASGDGASLPPAADVTQTFVSIMRQFAHPDIGCFMAWLDDKPVGGAACYVGEGVLGIFGTATLPEFRRRGVQRALVTRILNLAIGRADLAIATTEPGSTSQRTFERLGFQVLYTRAILVKA